MENNGKPKQDANIALRCAASIKAKMETHAKACRVSLSRFLVWIFEDWLELPHTSKVRLRGGAPLCGCVQRLRNWRVGNGLTQSQCAKQVGIRVRTLRAYEQAIRHPGHFVEKHIIDFLAANSGGQGVHTHGSVSKGVAETLNLQAQEIARKAQAKRQKPKTPTG